MIDYIDFIKIIKVLLICFIADYSLAQNNNPLDTNSAREYIYNLYGVDILELDHPGYVNVWLSQCGFLRPYNWFEIPLDNDFCILNFYLRGEKINTNQCVFWAIPVNFTDSCLILHSDSDKIFFPNDIEGIYAIYMHICLPKKPFIYSQYRGLHSKAQSECAIHSDRRWPHVQRSSAASGNFAAS